MTGRSYVRKCSSIRFLSPGGKQHGEGETLTHSLVAALGRGPTFFIGSSESVVGRTHSRNRSLLLFRELRLADSMISHTQNLKRAAGYTNFIPNLGDFLQLLHDKPPYTHSTA